MKKIFMIITLCSIVVLNYAQGISFVSDNITNDIKVGDTVSVDCGDKIITGEVSYITNSQINVTNGNYSYGFEYKNIGGIYDYTTQYRVIFDNKTSIVNNTPIKRKDRSMPYYIAQDYEQSQKCIKVGKIFVSIGAPLFVIGTITYCVGLRDMNTTACGVGGSIMGLGSTFIGVSIPLFCFGSTIKKSCMRDYHLYLNN